MIRCINYFVNTVVLAPILIGVLVSLIFLLVTAPWCNSKFYKVPEQIENMRKHLKSYVNLLF